MQIFIILIFIVVSYFVFTNSRLSEYASTAAKYDSMNYDLSISYSQDINAALSSDYLLDQGTISIKNPNKRDVSSIVRLYISENANLDLVDFIIDGNLIDTTNAAIKDGYYVITVLNCKIDAYENKYIDAKIKGDPFYITPFSYKFDVESF